MKTIIHRADSRGGGDYGWLKTKYSFSFANWHEPSRMGFGALRVINDDWIAPDGGFDPHSHKDMEIITIVMKGAVAHEDSGGGKGVVKAGEVQAMSAGTGVTHAEYNASKTEALELFQIWIAPRAPGGTPRYATKDFGALGKLPGSRLLVGPDGTQDALAIGQDAYITHVMLDAAREATYALHSEQNALYMLVINGAVTVVGETLNRRDAIGVSEVKEIVLATPNDAAVLVIEVPYS
jgi:redox-sensitive bicupin YhaK (pirin superfamily)